MPADPQHPADRPADDGAGAPGAAAVAALLDPALPPGVALTEALDGTATGAPLVRLLEALEPDALDDFQLVEVVAAAGRMAGWVRAVQARYAAALSRRPAMRPLPRSTPAGVTPFTAVDVAAQSLSLRLRRHPREMADLVRDGLAFDGVLAPTGAALAAGRIDVPSARAIGRRLHDQPWQVAVPVQEAVLPRAEHQTASAVRRDLERTLLRVDPEHAEERHEQARAERSVSHPRVLPDGMAALSVVLPAPEAVRVDTVLESCARTARAAGDPRTLAQLRADGLVDLLLGAPVAAAGTAAGTKGAPADAVVTGPAPTDPAPTSAGPRDPRTHVLVTVPLSTLLGADDGPGELAGYGPVSAVQARALALGGTWQRLVTDDLSGALLDVGRTRYRPPAALADHVRHRDRTCTAPGCEVPAARADLDHTVEYGGRPRRRGAPPLGDPEDREGPPGTTCAANLGPACHRHNRIKTETGMRLHQQSPGVFVWADPTGHRYRVQPGVSEVTEHLTAPRPAGAEEPDGEHGPPEDVAGTVGADTVGVDGGAEGADEAGDRADGTDGADRADQVDRDENRDDGVDDVDHSDRTPPF